jgi:uncharacterized damage-inducible protein DinB
MEKDMINANDLVDAFARNVRVLKMQTQGLTHEDSLRQLPFRGNCLNWVLGHLAASRDDVLEALGEPPMFGTRGARYERGSEPVAEQDVNILRLEELLEWLERAQERIAVALNHVDEAALSRKLASGGRDTTVGQRVFFLYFHETYHVGQTELFRQLAGKDDRVI